MTWHVGAPSFPVLFLMLTIVSLDQRLVIRAKVNALSGLASKRLAWKDVRERRGMILPSGREEIDLEGE